eukprot:TRINITY_DN110141_c0_g1_i1.p1 TRINITY_DN110141_c0_g1~~TRINITY_DN110141_c0_g1_i1.p1  ORF type:complete len:643 (-),score=139.68 TRINITY_DN110141_c0_g1_i1:335-2218(-)
MAASSRLRSRTGVMWRRSNSTLLAAALALAIAAALSSRVLSFVGTSVAPSASGRALRSTSSEQQHRSVSMKNSLRDSEGRKIKDPRTFSAGNAASVASTHTAQFKKRPFGVLAYAPSTDGKGAMVWEMKETSRYPGDPQGQAWVAGVRKHMAVKTVAGRDVTGMDFWDIMDLLDDKILDNSAGKFQSGGQGPSGHQQAELPVNVEFVQFSGDEGTGGTDEEWVDTRDERFADLPRDATIKEYKIPKAPPNFRSQVVEQMRSYVASLPEPMNHNGPRYMGASSLNENSIKAMVQDFKQGKLLPMKDAYKLAIDAYDQLVQGKTMGRVTVPQGSKVTVVGDLHGQLWDFDHMLGLAGFPSAQNQFVFNGDFVDRGPWSVEVMFTLLAFKVWQPNHVHMNRGNHEAEMANHFYGFFGEIEVKYEKEMTKLFGELFRAVQLCHVINDQVFVVHGGIPGPDPRVWWKGIDNQISFDGRQIQVSLKEIEESDRFMEPNPSVNPLMVDLLWSDPKGKIGYGPSGRMSEGIYLFGPDVSTNFMEYNNLNMVIRSHEVKAKGYRYDHDGQKPVVTVFSAPNYVDKAGNMAAVAVLTNDGSKLSEPQFIQYTAQPHPDVPSGAYAVGGPLHPEGVQR